MTNFTFKTSVDGYEDVAIIVNGGEEDTVSDMAKKFKAFLIAMGYTENSINKYIKTDEDDVEDKKFPNNIIPVKVDIILHGLTSEKTEKMDFMYDYQSKYPIEIDVDLLTAIEYIK